MKTIEEPRRKIPVVSKVDVVVTGGGCAGIAAAIAAARNGVKVALIERLGFAGGVMTATMMAAYWMFSAGDEIVVKGIALELMERLRKADAAFIRSSKPYKWYSVETEKFKLLADEIMEDEGIDLWYHSLATNPIVQENSVKGVIIESKSGRQAILAEVVIDTTGDGDIAARAGAPFKQGRPEDGKVQPLSIGFRITNVDVKKFRKYISKNPDDKDFLKSIKKARAEGAYSIPRQDCHLGQIYEWGDVASINSTRAMDKDPTNVRDLTAAEIELRKQVYETAVFLRRYIPGFANCKVAAIATQAAARESRRFIGEYILKKKDIIEGATFTDRIAKFPCFVDLHNPTGEGAVLYYPVSTVSGRDVPEQLFHFPGAKFASADTYDIPFRCLLPLKVENILTAGRCISATHFAVASIRYLPASMATAQAAGTAAALSVKQKIKPREVDVSVLQSKLLEQGVYLA